MQHLCAVIVLGVAAFLGAAEAIHAQGNEIALDRIVSDADRGVRARMTYDPYVLTGGSEDIVNDDGSVSTLFWDAYVGQFSAELTEGAVTGADAEAFLREAVIAVCPSVDRRALEGQWVQVDGAFLRIFAQCPEVDATLD